MRALFVGLLFLILLRGQLSVLLEIGPRNIPYVITTNTDSRGLENLVDENIETRWTSGSPRTPGASLTIKFSVPVRIEILDLDSYSSVSDSPKSIRIELPDSRHVTCRQTIIPLPLHVGFRAQFENCEEVSEILIFVQDSDLTYWWSVHEMALSYAVSEAMQHEARVQWVRKNFWSFVGVLVVGFLILIFSLISPKRPIVLSAIILSTLALAFSTMSGSKESWWFLLPVHDHPVFSNPWGLLALVCFCVGCSWVPFRKFPQFFVTALWVAVCCFFSSQRLYGDGQSTLSILAAGEWINGKEPLDRLITATIFHLGQHFGFQDPRQAVAVTSILAGLPVPWFLRRIISYFELPDSKLESLYFLILLTLGIQQIYFGNIENYSLLNTGLLFFVWSMLAAFSGHVRPWVPASILGITSAIHLIGLIFSPTLMLLGARTPKAVRASWSEACTRWSQVLLGFGIPMGLTILAFLLLRTPAQEFSIPNAGGGDQRLMVPLVALSSMYEKYTLLSAKHLFDILNELLLVSFAGVALTCAALFDIPVTRKTFQYRRNIFFLMLCGLALGFIFLFNPDLAVFGPGMLQEWDLMGVAAFPTALLGISLCRENLAVGFVRLLCITQTFLFVLWISYNNHP